MNHTRQYELIYIVSPTSTEQEVTDLHTQIESIIGRYHGELAKTENWGRRKLAYEIGGHKEGTYVLEVINGGGDLMKEIDRRLKVAEHVLRASIVRVDEELAAAERLRARRQVEAAKRAARMPAGAATGEGAAAATPVAGADADDDEDTEE